MIGHPARLETVRWWQSRALASSIGLSDAQIQAIDRIYQDRLLGRMRCVERSVEASNRVDQQIRDGLYDEDTLRLTQEVIKAASEEQALIQILNDDVAALLSPQQRHSLALLRPGRVIE
jgi:hypothetical protein